MSSSLTLKNKTIDSNEIAHFSKDSSHWWDLNGPFAPLHKLNPVRIDYILKQIESHYPNMGLNAVSIIDVGCGGGLVCEPLSRLGAEVTGIDADKQAIDVATEHAKLSNLDIQYINGASEDLDQQYDVVLALEIIEHVNDPAGFVKNCEQLVKPGGLLIMSTLNRTVKSFLGGVVAAEYIMRWVPQGTHDWKRFLKPAELSSMIRSADLNVNNISGIHYNPLEDSFSLKDRKVEINYLLSASKHIE